MNVTSRCPWRKGCGTGAAIVAALLIAAPPGAAQQTPQQPSPTAPDTSTQDSQPARTVRLSELEENPRQFLNQKITVSGEIENIVGPRLFTIDESEWVDFDGEILVAVPAPLAAMVQEDAAVRVTGTMRPFVRTELEREWGWFEPEGVEAEFSQRAVLVASSITTTENVELAVKVDFEPPSPSATGTSGTSTANKNTTTTGANTPRTISDLGRLASTNDRSLVGSRVELNGAKVAALADRGGFWLSTANGSEHLFVLPTEVKGGPVSQGQTVNVSGWLFQLPKGMKNRIGTQAIKAADEQLYVYAMRVDKAGGK